MSFAIMRLEKVKLRELTGAYLHNERERQNYGNENIDKNRTVLNYHLKASQGTYLQDVQQKIDDRYNNKRKIRTDANIAIETLFTSGSEFFEKLTPGEQEEYFQISYEFLCEFVGEENIVSAVVHLDEERPHMHAVFTPITDDGRLSTKDFYDGKKDLRKIQDRYFDKISKRFPQLERGKDASITGAKHIAIERLKKETNFYDKNKKEITQILQEIQESKKSTLGVAVIKEEKLQKLTEVFEKSMAILDTEKNKLEELQKLEDTLQEKVEKIRVYNDISNNQEKREKDFQEMLQEKYKDLLQQNEEIIQEKRKLKEELQELQSLQERYNSLNQAVLNLEEKTKIQGSILVLQEEQKKLHEKVIFEQKNYTDILQEGLKRTQEQFFKLQPGKNMDFKPTIDIKDLNTFKDLIYCREIVKNMQQEIHWSTKKLAMEKTEKILINSLGLPTGKDRGHSW